MIEVLIAMGIFLIGVVAIAAIFPAGITVQREAVEEMVGRQVATQARHTMVAMAQSGVLWYDPTTDDGTLEHFVNVDNEAQRVEPIFGMPDRPAPDIAAGVSFRNSVQAQFPNGVRSYPSYDNTGFVNAQGQLIANQPADRFNRRDYYWYPFLFPVPQVPGLPSATVEGWRAYTVILRRRGLNEVPRVNEVDARAETTSTGIIRIEFTDTGFDNDPDNDGLMDFIHPGDWVLGDNGLVARALTADEDGIDVSGVTETGISGRPLRRLYFAVNVDPDNPSQRIPSDRSPIVWIDEFTLNVPMDDPNP